MKRFLVGGAVRDMIMGLEPKDKDYVVPNVTEAEYEAKYPTHKKVGNAFPVYIDEEGNEVALARKEKVVGLKYQDFEIEVGVSLEDDLGRRDLSINSLAFDEETGEYIDPFGGIEDIKKGLIRTINPNAFSEDPLRILRALRFVVRYSFGLDVDTFKLMKESVSRLQDITPERIELELRKMYEQTIERPSNFFRLLDELGGLKYIGFEEFEKAKEILAGKPEFHKEGSIFNHLMNSLDYAKAHDFTFTEAIAGMLHDLGKIESPNPPSHVGHELRREVLENFFSKHRFTSDVMELSKVVFRSHMKIHNLENTKHPIKLVRFFKSIPKHRREQFFKVVNADSELNENQKLIIENLFKTFNETKIEIPKTVEKRGTDAIIEYVNNQYAQTYKEISK